MKNKTVFIAKEPLVLVGSNETDIPQYTGICSTDFDCNASKICDN